MNVSELIERLEDMDPDAEVRIAFQPSWPLQYRLGDEIVGEDEISDAEETGDDEEQPDPVRGVVYLSEGGQVYDEPYLPSNVRRAIGWVD